MPTPPEALNFLAAIEFVDGTTDHIQKWPPAAYYFFFQKLRANCRHLLAK